MSALAEGRAVLFLGPGLAHGLTAVDWPALFEQLKPQVAETAGWEGLDLADRAQLFCESHGRLRLDAELAALLPSADLLRPQVTDFHKTLLGLPLPVIVSTSPDELARAVLAELDVSARLAGDDAELRAALSVADGSPLLVELRGNVVRGDQTVLSREDHQQLPARRPALLALLRELAEHHTLVFYGFALTDPLFALLDAWVLDAPRRQRPAYALTRETNSLLCQSWSRRRVEVIAGNTWSEVERWTEGLCQEVAARRRTVRDLPALLDRRFPEQRVAVGALVADARAAFQRRLSALDGFEWVRLVPGEIPEAVAEPRDLSAALEVLTLLEEASLPVPAGAFAAAAELLLRGGHPDAARRAVDAALRAARRQDALTPALCSSLGRSLGRLGALDRARPLLEKAVTGGEPADVRGRAADLAWLTRCLLEQADELRERQRERALRELLGRFLVTFAPHFDLARTPAAPSEDPDAAAARWSVYYVNYRLGRLFTLASELAGQSGAVYAQQAIELLARAVELGATKPEPYRALRPLLLAPRGFKPDNKRWERIVTRAPAEVRRKLEELEAQEARPRARRS